MRLLVIAGLCAVAVPTLAQDDVKPLTGTYYMSPPIDSDDPKAPADHINFSITGDAAKAMWDAMKVETQPDECVGRMAKWVQSLVCYGPPSPQSGGALAPGDSPFECFMGVNLKNASIELSEDC
jgi:hypothetical protein